MDQKNLSHFEAAWDNLARLLKRYVATQIENKQHSLMVEPSSMGLFVDEELRFLAEGEALSELPVLLSSPKSM